MLQVSEESAWAMDWNSHKDIRILPVDRKKGAENGFQPT